MTTSLQRYGGARTVLLRMAADQERAARIRNLKIARPDLTWETIADRVGVKERSAIAWQATGAIAHENCGKLAEVFEVDPDWLWRGPKVTSPDLMGSLNGQPDQLDRIEAKLDRLLAALSQPDEPDTAEEVAQVVEATEPIDGTPPRKPAPKAQPKRRPGRAA